MEIIKGTPEEIGEYLNRKAASKEIIGNGSRQRRAFNQFLWRDGTKKHGRHWSNNKAQWVQISEMNSGYILNVLRKMLRENKNEDLLINDEFQSLSINLADKIVNGE